MGGNPTCLARITATGVSSTAVVSRERNTVLATEIAATSIQSSQLRPRPHVAARSATTLNSSASAASSVTTVIATTKSRIGQTRSTTARASRGGNVPVATRIAPTSSSTPPRIAVLTSIIITPVRAARRNE